MEIKIISLKGEDFKGLKYFEMNLDGGSAVIKAQNGAGKTTVYDMFLWLLFNKDSTGSTDFNLRPLDESNQPIKGLVLSVTAELELDGVSHIFKKEHHERIVKDQIKGYETLCSIDEVPKLAKEYADYIKEIVPETTFKVLTNLRHFNEGITWKERRMVLLDIAGEIGNPDGFDDLLAALNGRSMDDYKKVLATQKTKLKDEQAEINPRIDELQKSLTAYAGTDKKKLEKKRLDVQADITRLNEQQRILLTHEKDRQEQIENINAVKLQRQQRELELKNDTSGSAKLLEEKGSLESAVSERKNAVMAAQSVISSAKAELISKQNELSRLTANINEIRDRYNKASDAPTDNTCYACKQKLPADKIEQLEKKRKADLAKIITEGNKIKEEVDTCTSTIADLETELANQQKELEKAQITLKEAETTKTERFAEIDKLIKNKQPKNPKADPAWQDLGVEISRLEKELGESVAVQLQKIEADRKTKQDELAVLNKSLAQADQAKQAGERIAELEQQEKDLAQKIADIEKQLADIANYNMAESKLIESSVNGKFKHVKFKLFNFLLNGEIEPCCEAILNGVPYPDMSYGQRIFVGIDIINILSAHYGMSVPLFIDNSEGMTLPIEAESQTIELFAQKGISTLTVEKIEAPVKSVKTAKSNSKSSKKGELFNVNA
jgi:DNA repair exonuclease SbcCD ATPase subunit